MSINITGGEHRFTFEIGLILSFTLIILLTIGSCSVERIAHLYFESGAMLPGTVEVEDGDKD